MDERRAIDELIRRLIDASNIADASDREELRRELESHFEEAGTSPEARRAALERFGGIDEVTERFRRAYRGRWTLLYVAKVAASIILSTLVALVLQLFVTLRVDHGTHTFHLGRVFFLAVGTSLFLVLVLVAAWELGIEPLCARLEQRPLRLLATLAAIFGCIYAVHELSGGGIDPSRAFVASSIVLAVWTCTVAIVARLDLAFLSVFAPVRR
jgi:hypothetical protein